MSNFKQPVPVHATAQQRRDLERFLDKRTRFVQTHPMACPSGGAGGPTTYDQCLKVHRVEAREAPIMATA